VTWYDDIKLWWSGSSPIRVESDRVGFQMTKGPDIYLPAHYATFHDQSGEVLPKCDVFFGPYRKHPGKASMGRSHSRYFGSKHKAELANIGDIPIDGWRPIGKVEQIFYVRRGKRAPGGFHHPYQSKQPTLYEIYDHGRRIYKLSLGAGCLVDDRGFVYP
jgi:hypothetical protein